jgi:hypothetical protein
MRAFALLVEQALEQRGGVLGREVGEQVAHRGRLLDRDRLDAFADACCSIAQGAAGSGRSPGASRKRRLTRRGCARLPRNCHAGSPNEPSGRKDNRGARRKQKGPGRERPGP